MRLAANLFHQFKCGAAHQDCFFSINQCFESMSYWAVYAVLRQHSFDDFRPSIACSFAMFSSDEGGYLNSTKCSWCSTEP